MDIDRRFRRVKMSQSTFRASNFIKRGALLACALTVSALSFTQSSHAQVTEPFRGVNVGDERYSESRPIDPPRAGGQNHLYHGHRIMTNSLYTVNFETLLDALDDDLISLFRLGFIASPAATTGFYGCWHDIQGCFSTDEDDGIFANRNVLIAFATGDFILGGLLELFEEEEDVPLSDAGFMRMSGAPRLLEEMSLAFEDIDLFQEFFIEFFDDDGNLINNRDGDGNALDPDDNIIPGLGTPPDSPNFTFTTIIPESVQQQTNFAGLNRGSGAAAGAFQPQPAVITPEQTVTRNYNLETPTTGEEKFRLILEILIDNEDVVPDAPPEPVADPDNPDAILPDPGDGYTGSVLEFRHRALRVLQKVFVVNNFFSEFTSQTVQMLMASPAQRFNNEQRLALGREFSTNDINTIEIEEAREFLSGLDVPLITQPGRVVFSAANLQDLQERDCGLTDEPQNTARRRELLRLLTANQLTPTTARVVFQNLPQSFIDLVAQVDTTTPADNRLTTQITTAINNLAPLTVCEDLNPDVVEQVEAGSTTLPRPLADDIRSSVLLEPEEAFIMRSNQGAQALAFIASGSTDQTLALETFRMASDVSLAVRSSDNTALEEELRELLGFNSSRNNEFSASPTTDAERAAAIRNQIVDVDTSDNDFQAFLTDLANTVSTTQPYPLNKEEFTDRVNRLNGNPGNEQDLLDLLAILPSPERIRHLAEFRRISRLTLSLLFTTPPALTVDTDVENGPTAIKSPCLPDIYPQEIDIVRFDDGDDGNDPPTPFQRDFDVNFDADAADFDPLARSLEGIALRDHRLKGLLPRVERYIRFSDTTQPRLSTHDEKCFMDISGALLDAAEILVLPNTPAALELFGATTREGLLRAATLEAREPLGDAEETRDDIPFNHPNREEESDPTGNKNILRWVVNAGGQVIEVRTSISPPDPSLENADIELGLVSPPEDTIDRVVIGIMADIDGDGNPILDEDLNPIRSTNATAEAIAAGDVVFVSDTRGRSVDDIAREQNRTAQRFLRPGIEPLIHLNSGETQETLCPDEFVRLDDIENFIELEGLLEQARIDNQACSGEDRRLNCVAAREAREGDTQNGGSIFPFSCDVPDAELIAECTNRFLTTPFGAELAELDAIIERQGELGDTPLENGERPIAGITDLFTTDPTPNVDTTEEKLARAEILLEVCVEGLAARFDDAMGEAGVFYIETLLIDWPLPIVPLLPSVAASGDPGVQPNPDTGRMPRIDQARPERERTRRDNPPADDNSSFVPSARDEKRDFRVRKEANEARLELTISLNVSDQNNPGEKDEDKDPRILAEERLDNPDTQPSETAFINPDNANFKFNVGVNNGGINNNDDEEEEEEEDVDEPQLGGGCALVAEAGQGADGKAPLQEMSFVSLSDVTSAAGLDEDDAAAFNTVATGIGTARDVASLTGVYDNLNTDSNGDDLPLATDKHNPCAYTAARMHTFEEPAQDAAEPNTENNPPSNPQYGEPRRVNSSGVLDADGEIEGRDMGFVRAYEAGEQWGMYLRRWTRMQWIPALKLMTAEWSAAVINQTRMIGSAMDAAALSRKIVELQRREMRVKQDLKISERACVAASGASGFVRTEAVSQAIRRILTHDMIRRANTGTTTSRFGRTNPVVQGENNIPDVFTD